MKKFQNLIFDLDGTIIDSAPDIKACLVQAFQKSGLKAKSKQILIGPPLGKMISLAVPGLGPEAIGRIAADYRRLYDRSNYPLTKLYRGAKGLLLDCRKRNRKLYLVTNKRLRPTRRILKKFEIEKCFAGIYTVDSDPASINPSKTEVLRRLIQDHKLKPAESLFIGDNKDDIIAAKANKIGSVGVLYGYGEAAVIRAEHPSFLISKFAQLKNTLKDGGGRHVRN